MNEVRYFEMGRIYAENIIKAADDLGPGVVSLKPCLVQIREGFTWYEYIKELEGVVKHENHRRIRPGTRL